MTDIIYRDDIQSYSDQQLYEWLQEIMNTDDTRLSLPHIPFSYWELARELQLRDNIKNVIENNIPF